MQWIQISPESVEPKLFDLSEISVCMAAPYSGPDSMDMSKHDKWRLFVDVLTTCPVDGTPLPEATLYIFRIQGR